MTFINLRMKWWPLRSWIRQCISRAQSGQTVTSSSMSEPFSMARCDWVALWCGSRPSRSTGVNPSPLASSHV